MFKEILTTLKLATQTKKLAKLTKEEWVELMSNDNDLANLSPMWKEALSEGLIPMTLAVSGALSILDWRERYIRTLPLHIQQRVRRSDERIRRRINRRKRPVLRHHRIKIRRWFLWNAPPVLYAAPGCTGSMSAWQIRRHTSSSMFRLPGGAALRTAAGLCRTDSWFFMLMNPTDKWSYLRSRGFWQIRTGVICITPKYDRTRR